MHSCLKKYDPNFLVDDLLDYDTCFSIPQGYFVFDGPSTVSPSRGQRDPLSETQDKYPVLISLDIFRLLAEPSQVWNNCIVTSCLNAACAINKDPKIFVDGVIYNNPSHFERNHEMHARTSNVPPECEFILGISTKSTPKGIGHWACIKYDIKNKLVCVCHTGMTNDINVIEKTLYCSVDNVQTSFWLFCR